MAEDNKDEIICGNDQIEQLKLRVEELTANHLHLKAIVERLEIDLVHEIKQRENNQQHIQVISSLDKNREISAYVEENRSFIQSIWKKKK